MADSPQHRHASSSALSYDSSSTSSAASPRAHFIPSSLYYHQPPPSRPGSGLNPNAPVLPQPGTPPHRYDASSLLHADRNSLTPEGQFIGGQGLMQSQMSALPGHNQKRAYRQRRKDPSCDACRERKVKCDATDTTSCSECSSRNVRCQFTKETNRRMSSIKQVQDLERQLHQAKQEIHRLRTAQPRSDGAMDVDESTSVQLDLPRIGAQPIKRSKPPMKEDLSRVRANMRKYGDGLIMVPPPYSLTLGQHGLPLELPSLPAKRLVDKLTSRYYDCIHVVFPILHWPTFCEEIERTYRTGHFRDMPREWTALLFSILALGSLFTIDKAGHDDGKRFLGISNNMLDQFHDNFSLDRARMSFLTSILLLEMNLRSASWVWLGVAVRIAQAIGLHVQTGPWSTIEGEMRKRLWYCLYIWDRFLSLELGKPMVINDQDFDTEYPQPVEDFSINLEEISGSEQPSTSLLAMIHVARSLQHLSKIFKLPFIASDILHAREHYLSACMASFPPHLTISSEDPLDHRSLSPLLYCQNARLMLHRHNLTPSAPQDVRAHALESCSLVAKDTTHLLSRYMAAQDIHRNGNWKEEVAASATTVLCTHLWRCILILLLCGDYHPGLVLVRTSAAIGSRRLVNQACGRYISFFLSHLYDRLQNGVAVFEHDEEMMAYVSADLQGSADGSWIWQGSETGNNLSNLMQDRHSSGSPDVWRSKHEQYSTSPPSAKAVDIEWEGWDRIEQSVHYLLESQQRSRPQPDTFDQSRPILPPLLNLQQSATLTQSRVSPEIPHRATSDLLQPSYQYHSSPSGIQTAHSPMTASATTSPGTSRMNISHLI